MRTVDLTKEADLTHMRFTFTARLTDGNEIELTQLELIGTDEIKTIEQAKEIAKDAIEYSNGQIEAVIVTAYAWLPGYDAEYGVYAALVERTEETAEDAEEAEEAEATPITDALRNAMCLLSTIGAVALVIAELF